MAQTGVNGRRFVAKTGETCKDKVNGGCMLYTYCAMEFESDSVTVYYYRRAVCSVKEEEGYNFSLYNERKKYSWKAVHDTVLVPDFYVYGTYFIRRGKQLISRTERTDMLSFDEDEIYPIAQGGATLLYESRYGPSVNIRTVLTDTLVKKCNTPGVEKIIREIITTPGSAEPAGSVIDPDARYVECYQTTHSWASYAGILLNNDFCAERTYQPVKGRKLQQRFSEKEHYDSNSFLMYATRIYSFGRFLVIDDLLVHVGNATESGITITHYYEKKP